MRINLRKSCWWNRTETTRTAANTCNPHQTPTHLSQRTHTASMEATTAWMIARSCAHQLHSGQRRHHSTIHKAAHRSAHRPALFATIQMVSTVSTTHHLVLVISSKTWPTAHELQVPKRFQSLSGLKHLSNVPE